MSAENRTVPDVVVFDIGNVLVDWNPRYLYAQIFDDPAKMEWFLAEVCHHQWNLAQDAGRDWDEAAAEAIGRHPAWEPEIRAYRARWHEMISGAIAGTVALLEALHARGVPLYAITNWAADTFAETRGRYAFFDRFRDIVVSGTERIVKPDARIYRLLADRAGIDLGRALFIDDSAKNIAGAQALGMQTVLFTDPADLAVRLRGLGLLEPETPLPTG